MMFFVYPLSIENVYLPVIMMMMMMSQSSKNDSCEMTEEIIKTAPNNALECYNEGCKDLFTMSQKVVNDFHTLTTASSSSSSHSSHPISSVLVKEDDIIDCLYEKLTVSQFKDPRTNYNEYWIQKTMMEYLDVYR